VYIQDFLKQKESKELKAYLCPANVWTIGYGHTGDVKEGDEITSEEAEALFLKDLAIREKQVNAKKIADINQIQFSALVCLVFNIGIGNFNQSTLLSLLMINPNSDKRILHEDTSGLVVNILNKEEERQDDYNVIDYNFRRWCLNKGKESNGLYIRRKQEYEYYKNGVVNV
jgi:GH24 family phage-related lysozyme (muramidase)